MIDYEPPKYRIRNDGLKVPLEERRAIQPSSMTYGHPELMEVRRGEDGLLKFYISTRDGWEEAGFNGLRVELSVEHFKEGTRIMLYEPLPDGV